MTCPARKCPALKEDFKKADKAHKCTHPKKESKCTHKKKKHTHKKKSCGGCCK